MLLYKQCNPGQTKKLCLVCSFMRSRKKTCTLYIFNLVSFEQQSA